MIPSQYNLEWRFWYDKHTVYAMDKLKHMLGSQPNDTNEDLWENKSNKAGVRCHMHAAVITV